MPISPVEIRHIEFKRRLFGYDRAGVDRALQDVAASFEGVWRERADLADRVDALEDEVARHREMEQLLRSTLVSAERAAQEVKERAQKQADLIVEEAHARARSVHREAIVDKQRLVDEARRIEALLRAALESVGAAVREGEQAEEATQKTAVTPGPTPLPPLRLDEETDPGLRKVAG